ALLSMGEPEYRAFMLPLIPTLEPDCMIGIRTPELRRFARTVTAEEAEAFLTDLPHRYYEENNLHGILLGNIRSVSRAVEELDRFLPFVDNWATCDLIRPRCFRSLPPPAVTAICRWMEDAHPYAVRFGMEMLMVYGLGETYDPLWPQWVAQIRSEEYYVRMMQAWYFSAALPVRYEEILPYLTGHRLDPWTHNKTISKACDSFRMDMQQKAYLRTLRR
ncbi:MAG: DNA alkylation repair protein, partial [Clostridia bacterium]|nr:DNA alkylation repair protein [Clostridia bacterium]